MKRFFLFLIFIMVLSAQTTGCGIAEEKSATENVVTSYFEAVKAKDFDKALSFYSPKFFEVTPQDDWLEALKTINAKLGDLQTYKLTSWKGNKQVGTAGSGTYYELRYEVTYSKYPAKEVFNIFKPSAGGELKIQGHNINSIGLIKE
ncbi:MAG TPA: hypothetical protein G4O09_08570 [Dehalococcoidia bacterium]|jgi:hypothetical protein|nr:hypothetical protein [Dehalococcoidia bacterium]